MGRIVISENVTLDGVVQDPTGEDGFDRGGWWSRIGDDDNQAWAELTARGAMEAAALLLGRRTYEWLAARFPARTGAWADRLNMMPKYVVSSTLTDPSWQNSTVIGLDDVEGLDGNILVSGSQQLVQGLVERGLVDRVRLMLYPTALGAGKKVFDVPADFELVRAEPSAQVVLLEYARKT
jgi:dihydrofolate reductase